jgi:predicted dehydrogenase
MAAPPVRVGFVGAGRLGQLAHLRHYATLPDCTVVALAELRPELGQAVAQRYGVPHVYREATEMLANEALDAIVAPQPFWHHGQVLPPLLATGVPVFSEKPLAASVQVGEALLAAAARGGSWHMVGYQKRCDPATSYAKREVGRLQATGELGALRYIRLQLPSGDWLAGGLADLIRTDEPAPTLTEDPPPADMDGATYDAYRTFVNLCIHPVNLLRYLLGEPYRVTYAERSGVLLAAESASGVAAAIELAPYRTTVDWSETALVAFERGYVKLELPAPLARNRPGRVELLRDPGGATPEVIVPQLPWLDAMRAQAMAFLRAVRGEALPPCAAAEALEDLKVARDYIRLRGAR